MLSLGAIVAYCALAAIQGALVALPRASGSQVWSRLRSPGWALVLPISLIVGTFGVLAVPHGATVLAVLAALATPVLVGMAVTGVVRGPRPAWLVAVPVLAAGVIALQSWPAEFATSALTALGCLTVGAALVRLTPLRWLAVGIAAMCLVDVALLSTGVGQPAADQLDEALSHSALPELHRAQIGPMKKDYPDLVLAAVLGTALAGHARQLTASLLVGALAFANGALFLIADMLPATAPTGVAAAVVVALERRAGRTRGPDRASMRLPSRRHPTLPAAARPSEA